MATTLLVAVNNTTYTAIVAKTVCRMVEIFEDDQAGTTDYKVSGTGSDTDAITRPAGAKTEFREKEFRPNDVIAYVKTSTGTPNFAQREMWG